MNSIYTKKGETIQEVAVSNASVLDNSAQGESLQRKADLANGAAQFASLPPRPNNTGMPDNLKSGIESLSGFSMDDVRVHYNSSKPATVQALAYTQGTDIHVAPGQEKCLPHEAWHVAQQKAGRVSPTTNINGMPVNDNAALEHEADVMGEKAIQCKMQCCKRLSPIFTSNSYILQCDKSNVEKARKTVSSRSHKKTVIKVGVLYRTDSMGSVAVNYDLVAIDAINRIFSEKDNIEVIPVFLPKDVPLHYNTKINMNCGLEEITRGIPKMSDLDDIDMIFIPGNPHALTTQVDAAAITHFPKRKSLDELNKSEKKKLTSNVNHRFNPDLVTGKDKENYERRNREYDDRSVYEQRIITLARNRGIPVLGVCGGSWQLYNNFGGTTALLPFDQYRTHAADIKNGSAHMVSLEEKSMLGKIIGTNGAFHVNSTHWAAVLAAKDGLNEDLSRFIRVAALDDQRSPEAFETEYGAPMIGIQWHPETFLPGMDGYESYKTMLTRMIGLNTDDIYNFSIFAETSDEKLVYSKIMECVGEHKIFKESDVFTVLNSIESLFSSKRIFDFMIKAAVARQIKKRALTVFGCREHLSKKMQKDEDSFLIDDGLRFKIIDCGSNGNNCLLLSLGMSLEKAKTTRIRMARNGCVEARFNLFLYADTTLNYLFSEELNEIHGVYVFDSNTSVWHFYENNNGRVVEYLDQKPLNDHLNENYKFLINDNGVHFRRLIYLP